MCFWSKTETRHKKTKTGLRFLEANGSNEIINIETPPPSTRTDIMISSSSASSYSSSVGDGENSPASNLNHDNNGSENNNNNVTIRVISNDVSVSHENGSNGPSIKTTTINISTDNHRNHQFNHLNNNNNDDNNSDHLNSSNATNHNNLLHNSSSTGVTKNLSLPATIINLPVSSSICNKSQSSSGVSIVKKANDNTRLKLMLATPSSIRSIEGSSGSLSPLSSQLPNLTKIPPFLSQLSNSSSKSLGKTILSGQSLLKEKLLPCKDRKYHSVMFLIPVLILDSFYTRTL